MRSRYTAYTLAKINYIQKTMCKKAAENYDPKSSRKWASSVKWLGLKVLESPAFSDNFGTVTFIAEFSDHGKTQCIAEKSFFEKINGQWFYVDGEMLEKNH